MPKKEPTREELHERINNLRKEYINPIFLQAQNSFQIMLDGLESTINERITYNQGNFPEELIDMLWIVRSLGNKYGLNKTPDASKNKLFNGSIGKQLLARLEVIANNEFDTSDTFMEFDPESLRQLHAYVTFDTPVGDYKGIGVICDVPRYVYSSLEDLDLDHLIEPIWDGQSIEITDLDRLRTNINVASSVQSEAYGLLSEIYSDFHAIWSYQGEWIITGGEAATTGTLQFHDLSAVEQNNDEMIVNRHFKRFVDELNKTAQNYQKKVQNSGLVFNSNYDGDVWTMAESQTWMAHIKEQPIEYPTTHIGKAGNPVYELVEMVRKKLF
ncbi:hypothetical protein HON49_08160 [archaeon]|nr:hypothetical protein [archaeon]